jgi:hypothetical protein
MDFQKSKEVNGFYSTANTGWGTPSSGQMLQLLFQNVFINIQFLIWMPQRFFFIVFYFEIILVYHFRNYEFLFKMSQHSQNTNVCEKEKSKDI